MRDVTGSWRSGRHQADSTDFPSLTKQNQYNLIKNRQ